MEWFIDGNIIKVKIDNVVGELCEDIKIISITRNLSNLSITVKLKIMNDALACLPFDVELSEISKGILPKLIGQGLSCIDSDENENLILDVLQTKKNDAKCCFVHQFLGFQNFEGNEVFFMHHPVGNIEKRLKGSTFYLPDKTKPSGDFWTWYKMINKEILGNANLELALSLAALAPVSHILFSNGSLSNLPIIALIGDSSTGKTSVLKLIASVWGNPSESNGIISDLNSTQNAFFAQFGNMKGFPFLIDETSAESDLNFEKIIYYLPKGRGKLRCNGDGTIKSASIYTGAIIFTGETSLFKQCSAKAGTRARLIELSLPWTNDAQHADRITKIISQNHGRACYLLMSWIMKNIEFINSTYNMYLSIFRMHTSNSGITDRLSKIYSAIMVSAIAIKKSLKLNMQIPAIKNLLITQHKSVIAQTFSDEQLVEFVNTWILQNNSKFPTMEVSAHTSTIWGESAEYRKKKAVWIIEEVFENMVTDILGISLDKARKILHKNDVLVKTSDRHYKFSRTIAGKEVCCYILYTNHNSYAKKDELERVREKATENAKKRARKRMKEKSQVNILLGD